MNSLMWKQFLTNVRDEKIAGDLLEFGVSVGNSLDQLVCYCKDLNLDIRLFGFDSFEGLPAPSDCDPDFWHEGQFAASYDAVS